MTKPPRGSGGVAAELGAVDPRKAKREPAPPDIRERRRRPAPSKGRFRPGADPDARPTSLAQDDLPDPYEEALALQPRTRKGRSSGDIRVYHRAGRRGEEKCWAFTITRRAYERLRSERVLDHDGAAYPDGSPVVPDGANPLDYPVRCGSCGTHSVECLQILFEED